MDHENVVSNSGVAAVAFIADHMERSAIIGSRTALGLNIVVQPAVWALTDADPDTVDYGLYGGGILSGVLGSSLGGAAFALTSVFKGFVDDDLNRRRDAARHSEPERYRAHIRAAYRYGHAGQGINAMTIASRGGTAWEHPNGIWVYLTDARGHPVSNYVPNVARTIYQPLLPLRPSGPGTFRWHRIRG